MKSLFYGTGSVPVDVGHLPLLARLSGTLPDDMRDPDVSEDSYRQSLKTFFYLRRTSVISTLEVFLRECAI